jgi:glycine cleavage system H protein
MKKYTPEHEWVEVDGTTATVGISAHAATELGDITFVELPEVGNTYNQGDAFSVVESVKAASDIFSPVTGEVIAVNDELDACPELINASPEEDGWICKIKFSSESELSGLMTEESYEDFLIS